MAMTAMQGEVWKQITQTYLQWDPERDELMPVAELGEMLPAVEPELIGETLAQAASDQLAELGVDEDGACFRPMIR